MNTKLNKNLYGFDDLFNQLIELDNVSKLPSKFLISGEKGIGKFTFAYHLINFFLSKNEEYKYDIKNYKINEKNKSFQLVSKNCHPNFFLIDVDQGKSNISIDRVRSSFDFINKSSLNNEKRFILINNLDQLNLNSANSLLKVLEEPNEKLIFILIHNSSSRMIDTIKSRCVIFKKKFNPVQTINIFEKITNNKYSSIFDDNYFKLFLSTGDLITLKNILDEYSFDSENRNCFNILRFFLNSKKKTNDKVFQNLLLKLIQIFFYTKTLNEKNLEILNKQSIFFNKLSEAKRFNLDINNLYFDFERNILNG